ncbi:alkane 1-monooxygenase [Lutimonas halocynthiae]|uniref:alkane 1-monooxygenase n=1 Tax=Lutimonas halocynthiae TaxID=1446477 RepID=UPI0025B30387|nr:alkane 1-monooxygenase [Lutimonas halocynthiae]MDN3641590.1 alkane 1-monooxygenase [Lutimonas halocynthiae]
MKRLKYLFVFILPLGVYFSFNRHGLSTFGPVFFAFIFIPLIELFLRPDKRNLDQDSLQKEKNSKVYDWILYLAVPIQLLMLISFLFVIELTPFMSVSFIGKVFSMGLLCGVLGINIGHELGHRSSRMEQFLGEILLLTSLNTHFLPYHNEGHHREVATPSDAATAKKDQWLYSFWITSHFKSYVKAWKIENNRMRRNGKSIFSLSNKMIVYSIANVAVLSTIYFLFDLKVFLAFILAAVIGILLLGTVDYIEHYGLLRKLNASGRYERVQHRHSWNSDHQLGRLMLFNLSRHSDHHYKASKKYQLLESLPESPQMPTGYPGMMMLATIPPLFFWIMNKKIKS